MSWHKSGRTIAAALLLATAVVLTVRNSGVREIHRAQDPVNFAVIDARPAPGDWPWWRGIGQTGVATDANPPANWSGSDSSGWVVPVSGSGRAALCSWGDRLFLPTAEANGGSLSLLCLQRSTGQMLWQTDLHRDGVQLSEPRRSQSSTTPACDGQRVFLACSNNGALWVTAVDLNGRIIWQREAGPYSSRGGYSSSPAIYKSLVIVAADNRGTRINRMSGASYLAALHRHTGEIIWRIRRPDGDSSGTPVVARVAGRDQLLMAGRGMVSSYDPQTGESLWTCRWSAERAGGSVAFDDLHVYASARHPQPEVVCIRADGTGDVTRTNVIWRSSKTSSDIPAHVIHDGRLYSLSDDAVLACLDAATGQTIWKRRLGGSASASPFIAGQHLYCCNEEGTVFVIRLGGRGDIVAEIPVGDGILASPIVSQDRLYLRTLTSLRCVAVPSHEAPLANQPDPVKRKL